MNRFPLPWSIQLVRIHARRNRTSMDLSSLYYTSFIITSLFLVECAAENTIEGSKNDTNAPVGWQDSPSRRGTVNIIESCLLTILACTYSIQHPNIPAPNEGLWLMRSRKVKWMLLTICFPEFPLVQAIDEWRAAHRSMAEMKKVPFCRWWCSPLHRCGEAEHHEWWCSALYHCDHPVHRKPQEKGDSDRYEDQSAMHNPPEQWWTLTHSFYAIMGGYQLWTKDDKAIQTELPTSTPITSEEVAKYIRRGYIAGAEALREVHIKDKGKADGFTKMVAVLQISWLALSLLVRAIRHLAVSQLELVTLVFTGIAVPTYLFRWNKPKDIETSILYRPPASLETWMVDKLLESPNRFLHALMGPRDAPKRDRRIHNDNISGSDRWEVHPILNILMVATVAVGCVHLIAWNFEFPTRAEKILWRTAAFVASGIPIIPLWLVPIIFPPNSDRTKAFVTALLRALSEFGLDTMKDEYVKRSEDMLTKVVDAMENRVENYKDVFADWPSRRRDDFQAFVKNQRKRYFGYKKFPKDFDDLMSEIGGMRSHSYYSSTPVTTGNFPNNDKKSHQSARYSRWRRIHVIVSGIIYCLARLTVLALAFSSLRAMPDSVYVTTWTKYLPSLQ